MSTKNWVKKNGKYVDPATGREVIGWLAKDGRVSGVASKGFGKDNAKAIYDSAELKAEQQRFGKAINLKSENMKVTSSKNVAKGELFTFADADKNWDPEDPRAYRVGQLADGSWVYSKGDAAPSQTYITKSMSKNPELWAAGTVALNFVPGVGTALSIAVGTAASAHAAHQGTISKEQFWKGLAIQAASAGVGASGLTGWSQAGAQAVVQTAGAKWQGASWGDAAKVGAVGGLAAGMGQWAGGKAGAAGWSRSSQIATSAAAGAGTAYAVGATLGFDNEQLRQSALSAGLGAGAAQWRAAAAAKRDAVADLGPGGPMDMDYQYTQDATADAAAYLDAQNPEHALYTSPDRMTASAPVADLALSPEDIAWAQGAQAASPAIQAPAAASGPAQITPRAPDMTMRQRVASWIAGDKPQAPGVGSTGPAAPTGMRPPSYSEELWNKLTPAQQQHEATLAARAQAAIGPKEVKNHFERNAIAYTVGVPGAIGLTSAYLNKQSTDKQIAESKRASNAQLAVSKEAGDRTYALQKESIELQYGSSSGGATTSTVWN